MTRLFEGNDHLNLSQTERTGDNRRIRENPTTILFWEWGGDRSTLLLPGGDIQAGGGEPKETHMDLSRFVFYLLWEEMDLIEWNY